MTDVIEVAEYSNSVFSLVLDASEIGMISLNFLLIGKDDINHLMNYITFIEK
jgi:hypothetical protein